MWLIFQSYSCMLELELQTLYQNLAFISIRSSLLFNVCNSAFFFPLVSQTHAYAWYTYVSIKMPVNDMKLLQYQCLLHFLPLSTSFCLFVGFSFSFFFQCFISHPSYSCWLEVMYLPVFVYLAYINYSIYVFFAWRRNWILCFLF